MQMGNVGAYQPDAPVNDIRAITMDADVSETLIPSLAPFAPEPVAVVEAPTVNRWVVVGGLLLAVWLLTRKRGR